ncbi:LGFP repeat-containing protein [Kocuria rhizophila]
MPFPRSFAASATATSTAVLLTLLTGSSAAVAAPARTPVPAAAQPTTSPVQPPAQAPATPAVGAATGAGAIAPTTAFHQTFSAAGKTSAYHLYAEGIDRSKAVGVVYYLGGDYLKPQGSWVGRPDGPELRAMAAEARKKNMVLVVPLSPDHDARGDGITWWEDADGNGDWFRALQASLTSRHGLDTSRVWLAGYSGGAEFITYELLADRQSWIRGGGATIIGGGGSYGMQSAPGAAVRGLPLTWHVGSKDGPGSTNPPIWSALKAARAGQKRYAVDGFTRTRLSTLPGLDHEDYDIVGLLRQDLAFLPAAPTTTPPASWLRGAIRTDYLATGGAAVYGHPTSPERSTGHLGGVHQGFTRNWTFYWSPQTGAHPVKWDSGIGAAYRAAGLERAWGYPVMAERALPGGAYQDFRNGGARFRAMYSPRTGTHVVKLTGGIGSAWQRAGHEHGWGHPVTDEYAVSGGAAQKFSNGYVATWHRSTGKITVSRF